MSPFPRRSSGTAMLLLLFATLLRAAEPEVRIVGPQKQSVLTAAASQPAEYRYLAFPSLLRVGPDEVWIAYKAGRSHATDAGAAIEVIRHTLSTGATKLVQRLSAQTPKLYQIAELVRFPDGTIAMYIDVQSVGWDNRHYRSGAEVSRWSDVRQAFDTPVPLGLVNGLLYGYPLDFISEGQTTWQ